MDELKIVNSSRAIEKGPAFDELFQHFVAYLDASEKTIQSYTRAIKQFFKYLANNGVQRPTRETVIAYRDWLKLEHKPTTVQNYIVAIKQFFKWTAQEGIYPNISDHVKGAKLDRNHKKDYLTSRQVKQVLEGVHGKSLVELRDYAILALMFTGGLRTIEVSRANIEDIRTVGDFEALFLQGKGHEEKTEYIKLQPQVIDAIRAYLAARGHQEPQAPLFTSTSNNNTGARISVRAVSNLAKKAMVGAGFYSDRLTAHSTRHTAVTLALLGGQSLEQVQQFARHKNLATTLIYAHNLDRAKNQCEATIASAIF